MSKPAQEPSVKSGRITKTKNLLCTTICTFFGIGKIRLFPGTLASFITVLLFWFIPLTHTLSLAIGIMMLIIIGTWAIFTYSKMPGVKHDASEIVIDEVCGQLITICIVQHFVNNPNALYCILSSSFLSFRFFDIAKPFPISYVDKKMKNAWGIMGDDVLAAIAAALLSLAVMYYG